MKERPSRYWQRTRHNTRQGEKGAADMMPTHSTPPSDFIRNIIEEDLEANKNDGRVVTRFPPEPNGYLHIGHAKSICLNFGIAAENAGGVCHLRFDDTNPCKEEVEYVESIKADVRWLGFDWGHHLYYTSDYFDRLYEYALQLIKDGKAYVCSLNAQEIRQYRGTLTEPARTVLIEPVRWKRIWTCSRGCGEENSRTVPTSCEQRLIWHLQI